MDYEWHNASLRCLFLKTSKQTYSQHNINLKILLKLIFNKRAIYKTKYFYSSS